MYVVYVSRDPQHCNTNLQVLSQNPHTITRVLPNYADSCLDGYIWLVAFRMKAENWMSFLARDIPPLPKELFIWDMNLVLHNADSMEKKHWLHIPQECTSFVNYRYRPDINTDDCVHRVT